MRLRSGATTRNHERISRRHTRMAGSRRTSTSDNVNEDNIGLTNAGLMPATTTNPNASKVSSMAMSSSAQETVVVPPSTTFNLPVTSRPIMSSEYRTYVPIFSIPPFVGRDFPYRMPTSTMADVYTNPSMFSDNAATMVSPINTHLASGLKVAESLDNDVNMTKATEGLRKKFQTIEIIENLGCGINMVEVDKVVDTKGDKEATPEPDRMEVAYPKVAKSLVEFLGMCKAKKSKAMICQRCNAIFDNKAAQQVEVVQLAKWKGYWRDASKPQLVVDPHRQQGAHLNRGGNPPFIDQIQMSLRENGRNQ
ncbi:hypothetical protein KIW84_062821 [Lathyrus oleraceus]|uniref:Uncharacterized protein n=1 Tax=Pisum sativum TaxID=3888 RepID=A0A9D4W6U2_PEA|nr:hypothetical protein KIW84_062821 [Pisum sativum]